MTGIEWTAPPSDTKATIFTRDVLAALKTRPGEWACVKRAHGNATAASSFGLRNPDYEVTTRRLADKKSFDIYARYVGESR